MASVMKQMLSMVELPPSLLDRNNCNKTVIGLIESDNTIGVLRTNGGMVANRCSIQHCSLRDCICAQCFLSLKTGEVITQYAWDVIPMPTGVFEFEDDDVDRAEGNLDDAKLPGVVDMGMDESDDANQSPPEIPESEVNINEPNIIQPEQQLIKQQPPNAEKPVAKEPVQFRWSHQMN
jgi:hypothetical protein